MLRYNIWVLGQIGSNANWPQLLLQLLIKPKPLLMVVVLNTKRSVCNTK